MYALPPDARVAVVAALRQEIAPVVRRLGLRPDPESGLWRGHAGARRVCAVVTSMGTAAATRQTARLLDAHPADHVCILGIAGAVAPQLRIGELLHPEAVVDEASGRALTPTSLASGPRANAAARGRLLTTDTLHTHPDALARLRNDGYWAVDMETAAIATVADARGIPWSVFRAVSDRAGDPRLDAAVMGLSRPDGTPNPGALVRFLLTQPWRVPTLARLGRGMQRAVRSSTQALLEALEA